MSTLRNFEIGASLFLVLLGSSLGEVFAQRLSAPKLFPDNTLAYARIDDTRELRDRLRDTMMGRLGNDPELKPIMKDLYSGVVDLAKNLREEIGINLDELLSIPNGEFAVALVPTKTIPAICILLEAGSELPPLELVLSRIEEDAQRKGSTKRSKELAGIKLTGWENPDREEEQIGYFIDSGCFIACTNWEMTERLALTWTGNSLNFKPLTENRKFTSILSRCVGAAGERPQISYFADPIATLRELMKLDGNLTMIGFMLPILGLDGVEGVGGSYIVRPDDFDSISHMHLLLASPRKSLLEVLRPKSGSTDPETWVPDDVNRYSTLNWDFMRTLKAVEKIFDNFNGEGAFQEDVTMRISRDLGIDLKKDLFEQMNDRVSIAEVLMRPLNEDSWGAIAAIHLKNGKEFSEEVMPKLFSKLQSRDSRWTETRIGARTVYEWKLTRRREIPPLCLAVLGNQLLVTSNLKTMEKAFDTSDGRNDPLSDSLEYKMVRDRIKKQLNDHETSISGFERPEESLKLFYDILSHPDARQRLDEIPDDRPMLRILRDAMRKYKLPSFEVISQYLAPSGSFIYEDDSGLHWTYFLLRRER